MVVEQHIGTFPELDVLREMYKRALGLIDTMTTEDLDRPTPCAFWTVRDVIAHLASRPFDLSEILDRVYRGESTQGYDPHLQAQINQAGVNAYRNRSDLLEIFPQAIDLLLAAFNRLAAAGKEDAAFNFFAPITVRTAAATVSVDLAVHLWDCGRSIGMTVQPDPVVLRDAMPALIEHVLPGVFLPEKAAGLTCSYGIKISDIPNGEWVIEIADGRCLVERRPVERARVKMVAGTSDFLLLTFGRVHPLRAVLAGSMQVRGNPLLAMKFDKLFVKV